MVEQVAEFAARGEARSSSKQRTPAFISLPLQQVAPWISDNIYKGAQAVLDLSTVSFRKDVDSKGESLCGMLVKLFTRCIPVGFVKHDIDVSVYKEKAQVDDGMGLTLAENTKISGQQKRLIRQNTVELNMKAKSRHSASRSSVRSKPLFSFVATFATIFGLVQPSAAVYLLKPQQELPKACLMLMAADHNDCPMKDHYFSHDRYMAHHRNLNTTCCQTYPGKDFHCQYGYDNGAQFSMVACIATKMLTDGQWGRIVDYNTTEPSFQIMSNDSRSLSRPSWQVPFLYDNQSKTRCDNDKGERMLCRGVGLNDNRCTCKDGFRFRRNHDNICGRGFTDNDINCCVRKECEPGFHSETYLVGNFSFGQSCDEMPGNFAVSFVCVADQSIMETITKKSASTPSFQTPNTESNEHTGSTSLNPATPPSDADGKGEDGDQVWWKILVAGAIILVFAFLLLATRFPPTVVIGKMKTLYENRYRMVECV